MSRESNRSTDDIGVWGGGIVGGLVGGIGMGIVLHLGANQIHLFGTFVDRPTVIGGWAVHLTFSVLFGMVFAAVVSSRPFDDVTATFPDCVGLGFVYGALLGLFSGGFLLPLALNRIGASTYPVPFLPLPGIASELLFASLVAIAHLVYGLCLGAVYATINGTAPAAVTERVPILER